jgi:Major Facilitator Superfamily
MPQGAAGQSGLATLLRLRGWRRMFVAYAFSRMSAGTVGFTLLLIGQQEQHSLAHGAMAVTGYALAAAVTSPLISRAADVRGARRVLLATSAVYLASLAAVVLVATWGPVWLTVAAAVAGAAMPPIGPTFRATLTDALPDQALRSTALTVESVLVEGLQVVGPFLVTACVAVVAPQIALLIIATAVLGGTLALTTHPSLRAKPAPRRGDGGRLFSPPVLRIVGIWMVFTGALSAIEVIAVAFAGPHRVWLSGLTVAVLAGGSILGGVAVASHPLPGRPARQLQVLLAWMALAVALLRVTGSPVVFVLTVGAAALGVAPSMGIIMTLLGDAVPARRRSEAFGWMASANYLGGAAWTAGAGLLVVHGTGTAVGLTALSLLAGAALALKAGQEPATAAVVLTIPIDDALLLPERELASLTAEGGHA